MRSRLQSHILIYHKRHLFSRINILKNTRIPFEIVTNIGNRQVRGAVEIKFACANHWAHFERYGNSFFGMRYILIRILLTYACSVAQTPTMLRISNSHAIPTTIERKKRSVMKSACARENTLRRNGRLV